MKYFFWVASVLLFLGSGKAATSSDPCYETCDDPANNISIASTETLGTCVQRPSEAGGQGDTMVKAMVLIHDAAVKAGIKPGQGGEATLLAGLNAALPGATAPNPEGLSFCAVDGTTGVDAFYWVPNCGLAAVFCRNMTTEEEALGTVGYVVDEGLNGNDKFRRYAFNSTSVVPTEFQSPTLSTGFKCGGKPWFRTGMCTHPLATTCPTIGSRGRSSNQIYGATDTVVVGQQLRESQLAPCLDVAGDGDGSSAGSFNAHVSMFLFIPFTCVCTCWILLMHPI